MPATGKSWVFGLAFSLVLILVLLGGVFIFRDQEQIFREAAYERVHSVAELKANELAAWRRDRVSDAALFSTNPSFAEISRGIMTDPPDPDALVRVERWLQGLKENPNYTGVYIVDKDGHIRAEASSDHWLDDEHVADTVARIIPGGKIDFIDLHLDSSNGSIHFTLVAPLLDDADREPIGALVLTMDPEDYLYPYIQTWPVPSTSAETLLVRRDGDSVLFLNDLRFMDGAALSFRAPLSDEELPAARAILGQTGEIEGIDYRGAPVLASMLPVPDSPWYLISKMDTDEAFERLYDRLLVIIVATVALITTVTGMGILFWRHERARHYRRLFEAEGRFRAVFEQSNQGITMGLPDGRIAFYNPAMERLSGYTKEEVEEQGWFTLAYPSPEHQAEAIRIANEALEGNQPYVEIPIVRKDGQERWMSFATTPVTIEGEEYNLSIMTDIHELKTATERIREGEERFRLITENVPAVVYLCKNDEPWTMLYLNQQIEDITGVLAEDFLAGAASYAALVHPEDIEQVRAAITEAVAQGHSYHIEYRIVKPDGEIRWVEEYGDSLHIETGNDLLEGLIFDIQEEKARTIELEAYRLGLEQLVEARTRELSIANSELDAANEEMQCLNEELESSNEELQQSNVQLEETLEELASVNDQLQEASVAKSRFLANMSHELRTPLNSIIGFSGILAQGLAGELNDEQKTQISMIHASGQHLLSLINDILDIAKIEAGKVTVNYEDFNVWDVVTEVAETLAPLAAEKGLAFDVPDYTDATIRSDCGKVRQVLLNLAGNAIKFTSEGSVSISITSVRGKQIRVAITDTGPGILREMIPQLFEPFVQGQAHGLAKPMGTGLGLTLSQEHARLLDGRIEVKSEPGQGSTFTFVLPVVPLSEDDKS